MKKCFITIALAALQLAAVAQTVNVHFKNGQQIQYPSSKVDYVDFSATPVTPTLTVGTVVDLGLSVYWASCNLGADAPEQYGEHYAWGETAAKNKYSDDNYLFYDVDKRSYIDIGNNICGTEYDAATVKLGQDWRMPTVDEMNELVNECTWEWSKVNDIYGYRVTGKNGNSIFLPAAGMSGSSWRGKGLLYWTGNSYSIENAYRLYAFDSVSTNSSAKYGGHNIRPVTTNPNAGKSSN